MRNKLMLALLVVVLAALNYGVYDREWIKEHGETLLLELVPADPRSLMQGDYMRLRYALGQDAIKRSLSIVDQRGYMVIRPDANGVAQFVRFHKGRELKEGEKLLRFHKRGKSITIVPDSFFFQEGHARFYQDAEYGVFKFGGADEQLLIGLADENKELITPP